MKEIEPCIIELTILDICHNYLNIQAGRLFRSALYSLERDCITQAHNLLDKKDGLAQYFNQCKCEGKDLKLERLKFQRHNFASHYGGEEEKILNEQNPKGKKELHTKGKFLFFSYFLKGTKEQILEYLPSLNNDVDLLDGITLEMKGKDWRLNIDANNKQQLIEELEKEDFEYGAIYDIKTNHTSKKEFIEYFNSAKSSIKYRTEEPTKIGYNIILDSIILLFHYYYKHFKHPIVVEDGKIDMQKFPYPSLKQREYPLFDEKYYRNYSNYSEEQFKYFLQDDFDLIHKLVEESALKHFIFKR
jgi:hypothetical protein